MSDGAVRDLAGLRGLGLPTFAAAVCAHDSTGRLLVTGFREEVVCGGVRIAPGDLVLGDDDGVVVVSTDVAARALAGAEGSSPSRRSSARLSRTVRPWAPSTGGTASCDALGEADG